MLARILRDCFYSEKAYLESVKPRPKIPFKAMYSFSFCKVDAFWDVRCVVDGRREKEENVFWGVDSPGETPWQTVQEIANKSSDYSYIFLIDFSQQISCVNVRYMRMTIENDQRCPGWVCGIYGITSTKLPLWEIFKG